MAKIAFVDMTFHWPPTGGAWIDMANVMTRLQNRGHEVKLFAPDFPDYFHRGRMDGEFEYEYETLAFNRFSFNYRTVPRRFRRAVDKFQPDYIVLGDGSFIKPWLAQEFEKYYKTVIRFYSYEITCPQNCFYPPKIYGPHAKVVTPRDFCNTNFLEDPDACKNCFMPLPRLIKHAPRMIRKHGGNNLELQYYHEWVGSKAFTKAYQKVVRSSLENAHAAIVSNPFGRKLLKPYVKRIEVFPGGVTCSQFTFGAQRDSRRDGKTVVLSTGRVDDPVKGLEVIKGGMNILASRRDDFSLLITAGPHVQVDESYCYRMPWVSADRMPEVYLTGDIFVTAPLWQEPFGLVAVEAMASGLPVVATRVGGLQTIVEDGVTGFLVEPGDPFALSEKLEILLNDPELRRKMGAKARERAEELYDWDVVIDKYYMPFFS
ncbi:glycosyltransferase family 4 protein [Candidatus Hydrogenedentota bacterium]